MLALFNVVGGCISLLGGSCDIQIDCDSANSLGPAILSSTVVSVGNWQWPR